MNKIIDPKKILEFYKNGYFPMAENKNSNEINFYRPLKRYVIPINTFHSPKRLISYFKKSNYKFKINKDFTNVIKSCQGVKRKEETTWINDIILNTYIQLHYLGNCHSVECYENDNLIGGLYGVHLGSCFFGESMFSIKSNSSKFCLMYLIAILKKNKFSLLDSQFYNPHLKQFNAYEIDNEKYMIELNKGLKIKSDFKNLNENNEVLNYLQSTSHKS